MKTIRMIALLAGAMSLTFAVAAQTREGAAYGPPASLTNPGQVHRFTPGRSVASDTQSPLRRQRAAIRRLVRGLALMRDPFPGYKWFPQA
jgi:hypothetical protein